MERCTVVPSRMVLIGRAEPAATATARRIEAAGFRALVAPLRIVQAVTHPVPDKPDLLLATSATALREGSPIPPDWRTLPLHVVGTATREAARQSGFTDLSPARPDSATLVADLPALVAPARLQGLRVVYLAGEPRKPELERALSAAGVHIEIWLRYRMVPVARLPESAMIALAAGEIAGVTHFSAESARAFVALAVAAGLTERALQPQQICLSDAVAAALVAAAAAIGARVNALTIAETPTLDSLIAALIACDTSGSISPGPKKGLGPQNN